MKKISLLLISIILISLVIFLSNSEYRCHAQEEEIEATESEYLQGKITEVIEDKDIELEGQDQSQKYQELKVLVTKGSLKGQEITVENGATPMAQVVEYHKGDHVMILHNKDLEGNDVFEITDYIRTNGLLVLFIVFVVVSVLVGSKNGIFSLISMGLSFLIIFIFVLPQIEDGRDPVLIAILASIVMIPITFYLSHGFNKKTTVAMFGTFLTLIITGVLSSIFVNMAHLTGTASDESLLLQSQGVTQYNLKGLLFAGIIIGALGVLDDITVSQTAIVYQLHDVKNDLLFTELFKRSIQVGKDHIASMINTLILVYTGASLPLLLLFINSSRPFGEIINYELISTEIVRTLVGSIGLILAVPITTYLACFFTKRRKTISASSSA